MPNSLSESPKTVELPFLFVELPFLVFVHVADAQGQVTAKEAEVFIRLLNQKKWCKSQVLKDALRITRRQYARLWKRYVTGNLITTDDQIKTYLEEAEQNLPDKDKNIFFEDILFLAKEILKASGSLFQLSSTQRPKKSAFQSVENMVRNYTSQSGLIPSRRVSSSISASTINDTSTTHSPPSILKATDIWPLAGLIYEPLTVWKQGKIRMQCLKIIAETHDVKTFKFVSETTPLFFFQPGQFITLELEIEGQKVFRSYTLSSTPSRPHNLSITVKRVPGGQVSNWLHDNFKEGDEIWINGPYGKFSCFDKPAKKMLFISGGSGITPMMSMVRWLCDTGSECDMVFIHSARTPNDIIFRRELELLDAQMKNLKVAISCTRSELGETWTGFKGHLTPQMLNLMAPDHLERMVYVCGPPPFMALVKEMLENSNFPMANYNQENFGPTNQDSSKPKVVTLSSSNQSLSVAQPTKQPGSITKPNPLLTRSSQSQPSVNSNHSSNSQAKTVTEPEEIATLVLKKLGKEITCSTKDTILTIVENEGIEIVSSCRMGSCGTCKILKLEGEVKINESVEGLTEEEIEEGYVLACSSRAVGKVVLDV